MKSFAWHEWLEVFHSKVIFLWVLVRCLLLFSLFVVQFHLNKANSFESEAHFLKLELVITNLIVSSKIYEKPEYFNF